MDHPSERRASRPLGHQSHLGQPANTHATEAEQRKLWHFKWAPVFELGIVTMGEKIRVASNWAPHISQDYEGHMARKLISTEDRKGKYDIFCCSTTEYLPSIISAQGLFSPFNKHKRLVFKSCQYFSDRLGYRQDVRFHQMVLSRWSYDSWVSSRTNLL